MNIASHVHTAADWARPPRALCAKALNRPPMGALVCVAGLVILRQRPGTARGVVFITLEDETGTVNVVVWSKLMEKYRRVIMSSRLMRVTGRLERAHGVTHIIAQELEDITHLLDHLTRPLSQRAKS